MVEGGGGGVRPRKACKARTGVNKIEKKVSTGGARRGEKKQNRRSAWGQRNNCPPASDRNIKACGGRGIGKTQGGRDQMKKSPKDGLALAITAQRGGERKMCRKRRSLNSGVPTHGKTKDNRFTNNKRERVP